MPIRVVAIDDHPLMLKAILQELEDCDDIQVVGTAAHGAELYRLVNETHPDVVVLDLGMPDTEAFEPITAVQGLRQTHPDVGVLILTGYDDGLWMQELINAGALGYVLKSDDLSLCLPDGVRSVYRQERFCSPSVIDKFLQCEDTALSPQELMTLRLVAQGFANSRVAQELGLSEKTIRNTLPTIYRKLDVPTDKDINPRVAAINKAREMNLLEE